jgi:hypothetical protein
VFKAIAALTQKGWELRSPQPDRDTLNWSCNLALNKADETLHLHWSLFPAAARAAREAAAFEQALPAGLRTVVWNGRSFQVLSAEADLLHRLTDRPSWDPVPWQADVLMMSFADIDWHRFNDLVERFVAFFEPADVLQRLMDLRRDWQLPIPQLRRTSRRLSIARTAVPAHLLSVRKLRSKLGGWRSLLWKA